MLFIVEGLDDEIRILHKILCAVYGYEYERLNRNKSYHKYKPKNNTDVNSSIFVINSKESCIKDIMRDAKGCNEYLDELFNKLREEYKFPVDKAAIYYIFDRDIKSNVDAELINDLLYKLRNSRDENDETFEKGLLLLSYPSIESFIASNFISNTVNLQFEIGKELKEYLDKDQYTIQKINEGTLKLAIKEMLNGLNEFGIEQVDLDSLYDTNKKVYDNQEHHYSINSKFRLISLLCVALLDLGLIEIIEDELPTQNRQYINSN